MKISGQESTKQWQLSPRALIQPPRQEPNKTLKEPAKTLKEPTSKTAASSSNHPQPASSTTNSKGTLFKAIFDYSAKQADELSLKVKFFVRGKSYPGHFAEGWVLHGEWDVRGRVVQGTKSETWQVRCLPWKPRSPSWSGSKIGEILTLYTFGFCNKSPFTFVHFPGQENKGCQEEKRSGGEHNWCYLKPFWRTYSPVRYAKF